MIWDLFRNQENLREGKGITCIMQVVKPPPPSKVANVEADV